MRLRRIRPTPLSYRISAGYLTPMAEEITMRWTSLVPS